MKAILNNRLWVPIKIVKRKELDDHFKIMQFEDKVCEKCDYFEDRPCDICMECPSYLGTIQLWKRKGNYIGIPFGDRSAVKAILKEIPTIEDRRVAPKQKYRIKITSKRQPHQEAPIKQMLERQYGILEAPPRSGKTFMAIDIAARLGFKTMVLAAQEDWLDQFLDDFYAHTNVRDVEKWEGRKIVGKAKTPEEIKKLDFALCTYQSFISAGGAKRLKEIADHIGVLIIDEVHGIPATEYARVIGAFKAKVKIGLTGTPDRKDGLMGVAFKLIGKVTARATVETMKPRVTLHLTQATTSYHYKQWTSAMKFLYTHKKRNLQIIKSLVDDIKAGRYIVVPCGTVAHAKLLAKNVNHRLGKEAAIVFTSKTMNKITRKQILDKARTGKIRCIIGTRQLLQVGINVPRWDTLYEIAPISNVPKFSQETARIRTIMEGKPQPIIRFFVEEFGPSIGCMRTCLFQTFLKGKFDMDKPTKAKFMALSAKKKPGVNASFDIV